MNNYSLLFTELSREGYSDEQLKSIGWFETPRFKNINAANTLQKWRSYITPGSRIGYFPGAFTIFHEGHVEVIKQFFAAYPEAVVVIAPANTDYLVTKYGKDNPYIDNKGRYDRILDALLEHLSDYIHRITIDLNPMLNNIVDHNFTDLLDDFLVKTAYCHIFGMRTTPYILTGKDREYFKGFETAQSEQLGNTYVKVFYVESHKDYSSRNMMTLPPVSKKKLLLRINNIHEYDVFMKYFSYEYESVSISFIEEERTKVRQMIQHEINTSSSELNLVTICKDYADILPYVKMSRTYSNPLEPNGYTQERKICNSVVIDSDSFTGGTRQYLVNSANQVRVIHDFSYRNDWELLDIDDFKRDNFCYPHVDISSRCSMAPFTKRTHEEFAKFVYELKGIKT